MGRIWIQQVLPDTDAPAIVVPPAQFASVRHLAAWHAVTYAVAMACCKAVRDAATS